MALIAVTVMPRASSDQIQPSSSLTSPEHLVWTAPRLLGDLAPVGPSDQLHAISCPSPQMCVAGDGGGSVLTSVSPLLPGAVWHRSLIDVGSWITSASCPSIRLCVLGSASGDLFVATSPAGEPGGWIDVPLDKDGAITSVSCPTDDFCAVADAAGRVMTSQSPKILELVDHPICRFRSRDSATGVCFSDLLRRNRWVQRNTHINNTEQRIMDEIGHDRSDGSVPFHILHASKVLRNR